MAIVWVFLHMERDQNAHKRKFQEDWEKSFQAGGGGGGGGEGGLSIEYFQQYGMCKKQSLRSACAYAQSDQSLCLLLEYSMSVKLLTEHCLEFLSFKGGCTGSSESTLKKCHIVGNHM